VPAASTVSGILARHGGLHRLDGQSRARVLAEAGFAVIEPLPAGKGGGGSPRPNGARTGSPSELRRAPRKRPSLKGERTLEPGLRTRLETRKIGGSSPSGPGRRSGNGLRAVASRWPRRQPRCSRPPAESVGCMLERQSRHTPHSI
jgi:hypothetical protein